MCLDQYYQDDQSTGDSYPEPEYATQPVQLKEFSYRDYRAPPPAHQERTLVPPQYRDRVKEEPGLDMSGWNQVISGLDMSGGNYR